MSEQSIYVFNSSSITNSFYQITFLALTPSTSAHHKRKMIYILIKHIINLYYLRSLTYNLYHHYETSFKSEISNGTDEMWNAL